MRQKAYSNAPEAYGGRKTAHYRLSNGRYNTPFTLYSLYRLKRVID